MTTGQAAGAPAAAPGPAAPDPAAPGSAALAGALLDAIRAHRAEFEQAGVAAEELRDLPEAAVAILADMGAFWLKTPAELGGTPLSPLDFCDVIEELAYADSSTAWAAMIGAGCNGLAAGWLPESGARRVFAPGRRPVLAGQPQPRGTGRRDGDGYVVSGRWSFASGIMHASWLIGGFTQPGRRGEAAGPPMVFVCPRADAEIIDTWHVAGLQGTGSMDFALDEVFVPAELTYPHGAPAVRGGDLFRAGHPAFVSNEVPPFCAGTARRALDDMIALAAGPARLPGGTPLAARPVFAKELGRAQVRITAARLAHREAVRACWQTCRGGAVPPAAQLSALTAASVFAVETCAEVISDLFRYGGGRVLALSHPMQRHLRNALAARQHVAVSEEFYEAAGRLLLDTRGG